METPLADDYYPDHASPLHIMPFLPETHWYYPSHEAGQRTSRDKAFHAYTYRVLKGMSNITINKHGLALIDRYLHALQNKLCRCIAHMLNDARHVTVKSKHLFMAARVVFEPPLLDTILHDMRRTIDLYSRHSVHNRSTLTRKCELVFPPSRFRTRLNTQHHATRWRISVCSNIACASILQTFTRHLLAEAIEVCVTSKKRRILVDHVLLAVDTPAIRVLCTQLREDAMFKQLAAVVQDHAEEHKQ